MFQTFSRIERIPRVGFSSKMIVFAGGGIHPSLVPYDILTDREKKRDREIAMELLRFLQMHGYRIMGWVFWTCQPHCPLIGEELWVKCENN